MAAPTLEARAHSGPSYTTLLDSTLDGSASTSELVQSSERYGMHEAGSYWVVRGSLTEDGAESCLRSLERQGSSPGFVPLLARHGLGVSGIVGRSLETFGKSDATLAVVGPVSMERLTDAFGEASRVLRAALQLGCRGVVDMATLSLRLAVVEQKDVAAILYRRYIAPVRAGSSMADDILDTIDAFLVNNRSIQATAKAISVHVNTARYRFDRFEELTGRSLTDTDTLVEIWWALQIEGVREQDVRASTLAVE